MLCVAVLAVLAAPAWGRALQSTDANCQAYGSLQIRVEGGSCWAKSQVTCDARASTQSQYDEAIKDWFGNDYYGNICNSGKAEAAARAIARAVADVYTSAYQAVECSEYSQGSACGWQQSNGDAWALATARAVASAMADAGGDGARGFCLSDVEAISVVVADVAAESLLDGCVGGGASSYQFTESRQTAIAEGIAEAFAKASASSCKNGSYDASASSECEGDGLSDAKISTSGSGSGFAKAKQVTACSGGVNSKCCSSSFNSGVCLCGSGCERGAYKRTSVADGAQSRTWVAPSGKKCFCA